MENIMFYLIHNATNLADKYIDFMYWQMIGHQVGTPIAIILILLALAKVLNSLTLK